MPTTQISWWASWWIASDGDAFFGGFLYRYLQLAKSPAALTIDEAADCARFGNATASLCVEGRGGIPSMPTREAVEKRMQEGAE